MHYHQTPFNISLIVEQLLNNNVELIEKVNMMVAEKKSKETVEKMRRLIKQCD